MSSFLLQVEGSGETAIVKVCILASSSSGNATFIATPRTRILIDAGLSRKATFERLQAIGEDPGALDAIVVSHEHSDHVSGLVTIAKGVDKINKTRRLPIYATWLTAPTIDWNGYEPELREFQAGSRFAIGDIDIQTFTTPHDAADPVGFCFRTEGRTIGLATDLGYVPDSVKFHLRGADFLILESNHDIEMLKVGPYPWQVKQRVMSRKGHLSNDLAGEFIATELAGNAHTLVLGHLSEHNNHPEIARVTAQQALDHRGLETRLVVALPRCPTDLFEFE